MLWRNFTGSVLELPRRVGKNRRKFSIAHKAREVFRRARRRRCFKFRVSHASSASCGLVLVFRRASARSGLAGLSLPGRCPPMSTRNSGRPRPRKTAPAVSMEAKRLISPRTVAKYFGATVSGLIWTVKPAPVPLTSTPCTAAASITCRKAVSVMVGIVAIANVKQSSVNKEKTSCNVKCERSLSSYVYRHSIGLVFNCQLSPRKKRPS